jgi:hypothetical protein
MMSEDMLIRKASGELAPFSSDKLLRSLVKSGATPEVAEEVLAEVKNHLHEGMSTQKIYRLAYRLLKKRSRRTAAKYCLKQAIMEMGPSGFPFERFIGELFKAQGYRVQVGQIVSGRCVTHEIDVIAESDAHHYMVECKYHNVAGIGCNVKVPLYVYSRFKDVEAQWLQVQGHAAKVHQPWIVTNTKFTLDAIRYGECMGMKLLAWNYPEHQSLRALIEEYKLHPITAMTTLGRSERRSLMENRVVLCSDLQANEKLLHQLKLPSTKVRSILDESINMSHD